MEKHTSKVVALYYTRDMSIYLPMSSLVQLQLDSWSVENYHFFGSGGQFPSKVDILILKTPLQRYGGLDPKIILAILKRMTQWQTPWYR